jgi:hypothetical protein
VTCPSWTEETATHLGLERIKRVQALGQRVWNETCPQYMLLTEQETVK